MRQKEMKQDSNLPGILNKCLREVGIHPNLLNFSPLFGRNVIPDGIVIDCLQENLQNVEIVWNICLTINIY